MKKIALLLLLFSFFSKAQSYPPAAEQPGSTAIPADSQSVVGWATAVTVTRGYVTILDPSFEHNGSNFASFGEPNDALGQASNTTVSLGDAGTAILTFAFPIADGVGFDFAVFENSFSDTFLELAFVEVSSDGTTYFRFPSHSETQTDIQVEGFGDLDPTFINNLAGKYRGLFGTPFDISEIQDNPLLNKNNITHVKIIDVVGSIDQQFGSIDSFGNLINDPFTTPFFTGGFDLDAVGVLNQNLLSSATNDSPTIGFYPNPVSETLFISTQQSSQLYIYDISGRIVFSEMLHVDGPIDVSAFENGVYLLTIISEGKRVVKKFIKN